MTLLAVGKSVKHLLAGLVMRAESHKRQSSGRGCKPGEAEAKSLKYYLQDPDGPRLTARIETITEANQSSVLQVLYFYDSKQIEERVLYLHGRDIQKTKAMWVFSASCIIRKSP